MDTDWAGIVVITVAAYLAAGVVFAIAFVLRGAARVDPAARHLPWGARLVLLPGVAALWPLMLAKWRAGRPPPVA